jgi:hypothetical protein
MDFVWFRDAANRLAPANCSPYVLNPFDNGPLLPIEFIRPADRIGFESTLNLSLKPEPAIER